MVANGICKCQPSRNARKYGRAPGYDPGKKSPRSSLIASSSKHAPRHVRSDSRQILSDQTLSRHGPHVSSWPKADMGSRTFDVCLAGGSGLSFEPTPQSASDPGAARIDQPDPTLLPELATRLAALTTLPATVPVRPAVGRSPGSRAAAPPPDLRGGSALRRPGSRGRLPPTRGRRR